MKPCTAALQAKITNIYNHLYANAEMRTPHAIANEVGKILHVAMFIEEQLKDNVPAFSFSAKQSKDILNGLNEVFAQTVRRDFSQMNKRWKFYSENDEIKLNDFDIAYTCSQLSEIVVSDKTRDVFGDALEIFRASWAKQIGGQFFTDSLVTRLALRLLAFDPRQGDDLVDICAGTGGFLLAGLNHIREILEQENGSGNVAKELVKLARKSLKGREIDSEVCRIANATLALRLGQSGADFVQNGDSLMLTEGDKIRFDSHLCVASNPPFGTKITVKDYRILQNFALAKTSSRSNTFFPLEKVSQRSPDILFVEQNVKLLVPGKGRLALVVPYQILSGPQTSFIRNWLLKNTIIQSVIDLPAETFQPHTGTKTCLLTVKRREKPLATLAELEDYQVFMATPKWIGHDRRGNPVYQRTPDGKQSQKILTDFPQLEEAFAKWQRGENPGEVYEDCFVISSRRFLQSDLQQLNAQFYRPSKYNAQGAGNGAWKFVKIEDVVKRIFYPTRFKRHYVDYFNGAIPFFGGSDILQLFSWTGKWLAPNSPKLNELTVEKDWLLITRSGSTGIVSRVPEAWAGYAMSEHIIRLVPDETKISHYYLLGFLRSEYCQEIIGKGVFGSVIDEIDPSFIGKIEMPVPASAELYRQIIEPIQQAEQARNEAIMLTETSLKHLNAELKREFSTV